MPLKEPKWRRTYLREYRERAGLSQVDAAEQLGYADHSTLSKIENGHNPYNQELLENAAKLYKCSVFELLFIDPDKPDEIDVLLSAAEIVKKLKRK
jgi:transcriptional regulator with XRE-family HTH domain